MNNSTRKALYETCHGCIMLMATFVVVLAFTVSGPMTALAVSLPGGVA